MDYSQHPCVITIHPWLASCMHEYMALKGQLQLLWGPTPSDLCVRSLDLKLDFTTLDL